MPDFQKNPQQFNKTESSLAAKLMVAKTAYNKSFAFANLEIGILEQILISSSGPELLLSLQTG